MTRPETRLTDLAERIRRGQADIVEQHEIARIVLEQSTALQSRDAEIARLRAALKPFADLASIYVRRADTFEWKDDSSVFGATDMEMDAQITVGHCRAALKALEET